MSSDTSRDAISVSIPHREGDFQITIELGSSAVFCGANGSGKTRLAVYLEQNQGLRAHRISAHRALTLNPGVARIPEQDARNKLRTGELRQEAFERERYRTAFRWGGKEAVSLLNDFDSLLQVLFAEQTNTALKSHKKALSGSADKPHPTKFEYLREIWELVLPPLQLEIDGDDITVVRPGPDQCVPFSASELSDGERAVFYLIGQTLVADKGSLLIIDEPELHVHPSIMARLWDELEATRPDCGFAFITHDLQFASSRAAQKFMLRSYGPGEQWEIEEVPEETGFSGETATLILGSRQPVLFVEGTATSLDVAVYRACFPGNVIIPIGSCGAVIHAVETMRRHPSLSRVSCSGIIDADARQPKEVKLLNDRGVQVLPVAEIENVVLLPEVSRVIGELEGYTGTDLDDLVSRIENEAFKHPTQSNHKEAFIAGYCRRRVDWKLKRMDLSDTKKLDEIQAAFEKHVRWIDIKKIAKEAEDRLDQSLKSKDIYALLSIYDNKGLLGVAAHHLKGQSAKQFRQWLIRVLGNDSTPELRKVLGSFLPDISPCGDAAS